MNFSKKKDNSDHFINDDDNDDDYDSNVVVTEDDPDDKVIDTRQSGGVLVPDEGDDDFVSVTDNDSKNTNKTMIKNDELVSVQDRDNDDDDDDGTNHNSDISSSLPLPEMIHATSQRERDYAATMKHAKRCWIVCCVLLTIAFVLSIALTQTKNKRNNNNDSNDNAVDSEPSVATKFNTISSYLIETYGFDGNVLLNDTESAQYKALIWLARDDIPSTPTPNQVETTDTAQLEAYTYLYLTRYVAAVTYYSLNGPTTWSTNASFLSPGVDVCEWHQTGLLGSQVIPIGLYCNDNSLTLQMRLFIHFMNATGTIPTELGLLTTLEVISMTTNNYIEGTIPSELCQLTSLLLWDVSENNMNGEIPDCIGNLQSLQALWLSNNQFDGSLPESLGTIRTLEHLYMDDNQFSGDPSNVFIKLKNLQVLFANSNDLTGTIDTFFSSTIHTNLEAIDLSHNNITTSYQGFPVDLLMMKNLTILDISNNDLDGVFPISASMATTIPVNNRLQYLSLYSNQLSGSIPRTIKNLVALEHLDLSNNALTGTLPSEVGDLVSLTYLFLSNNPDMSTGPIPTTFERLRSLQELSLRNIARNGTLPDYFYQMRDLTLLDLSSNLFTGTVPKLWGNISEMQYLLINDNPYINGTIGSILDQYRFLRAGFIDGTSIVDDLNQYNSLNNELLAVSLPGGEVLYADCDGNNPKIQCDFCECCDSTIVDDNQDPSSQEEETVRGCSKPLLSNYDGIWEAQFGRRNYQFEKGNKQEIYPALYYTDTGV